MTLIVPMVVSVILDPMELIAASLGANQVRTQWEERVLLKEWSARDKVFATPTLESAIVFQVLLEPTAGPPKHMQQANLIDHFSEKVNLKL